MNRPFTMLFSPHETVLGRTTRLFEKLPAHAFIHDRSQSLKLATNPFYNSCILHAAAMTETQSWHKANLTRLLLSRP
jgi:hypothetical protein